MKIDEKIYYDKVYGCWIGKSIGGSIGTPLEGKKELFQLPYEYPEEILANDDLDLQLVWLDILRKKGVKITSEDLAEVWVNNISYLPDEYGVAKANLKLGLKPPITGIYNNWFKNCYRQPSPDEYEKYAESFNPLRKVVWSLTEAGGRYEKGELERIISLKKKYPNITGAIMDDFFIPEVYSFTPEKISKIRERLHRNNMELWTVLYHHQLELNVENYLKEFDVITYWTWYGDNLISLEKDFEKFLRKTEGKEKMLGCYMWNYGNEKSLPLKLVEKQCNLGLKWMDEGKIEGIIFLASCICDLKLETVEWVRKWIKGII